jgi:hypothetical protein
MVDAGIADSKSPLRAALEMLASLGLEEAVPVFQSSQASTPERLLSQRVVHPRMDLGQCMNTKLSRIQPSEAFHFDCVTVARGRWPDVS